MQKEIEALSIFPELSTLEWFPRRYWIQEPASEKKDKIKAATALLRKSKFQGDKRIVIHHPYKPVMPPVQPKEEEGYDEVFKLPQEVKPSTI